MKTVLEWKVGHVSSPDQRPEEMVPAVVPGAVQLDWAVAHQWPDYRYDVNFRAYKWMEDCYWIYQAQVAPQELGEDETLQLVCDGIDYEFDILMNGEKLFYQEGMFKAVRLDLTKFAKKGGLLEIVIYPTPKDPTAFPNCRDEARQSVKPAAAYEWDWHPRLIPLGIWEEIYLEVKPASWIKNAKVTYKLSDDLSSAAITCSSEVSGWGPVTWTICDPNGKEVFAAEGNCVTGTMEQPQLWWCNGYGDPALYSWKAKLPNGEEKSGRIGFRTVKLVMNEGAWIEPIDFPKSRSVPPITLELNHLRIFGKGTNWVNPEIFPGVVTKDTYEPQLRLAQEAHMNLIRCWGGAYIDKESFFELCDELGLMVWQEFPLACNDYYDSEHYLAILEQEATAIIERLAPHPSLVLWCGGNELFNNWSGMDEQKLALRLLNKLCYDLDRDRPYINTSPLMGMGHGCYLFRYKSGEEVYHAMQNANNTAYTEFGVPSISDKEYLLQWIPAEKVEPFVDNDSLRAHHAFGSWEPTDSTWACVDTIEDYFGPSESVDDLIAKSQWMQCEGYKGIYEEARRQKPYCSMALNWCYNEPWPTAANNSLLNYPARPKPAYEAVKESLRPTLASARIQKFVYESDEMFETELWLLNDSTAPIPAGHMNVYLEIGGVKEKVFGWDYPEVPAGKNLLGPTIHQILPVRDGKELVVSLEDGERSSSYRLIYRKKEEKAEGLKILNA